MPKEEEKITIRRFKDGSMNFWAQYRHYYLTEDKQLILCAGGDESEEHRQKLIQYLKRNKLI